MQAADAWQAARDISQRWERMNRYLSENGGWITSLPGHREITFECLPDSMPA
jgi:hypothetical protein